MYVFKQPENKSTFSSIQWPLFSVPWDKQLRQFFHLLFDINLLTLIRQSKTFLRSKRRIPRYFIKIHVIIRNYATEDWKKIAESSASVFFQTPIDCLRLYYVITSLPEFFAFLILIEFFEITQHDFVNLKKIQWQFSLTTKLFFYSIKNICSSRYEKWQLRTLP